MRDVTVAAPAAATPRMPPESAPWFASAREVEWERPLQSVGIERIGATLPMLREGLVSQSLEGVGGRVELSIPRLVTRHLRENGGGERILLRVGQLGDSTERLVEKLSHARSVAAGRIPGHESVHDESPTEGSLYPCNRPRRPRGRAVRHVVRALKFLLDGCCPPVYCTHLLGSESARGRHLSDNNAATRAVKTPAATQPWTFFSCTRETTVW